MSGFTGIGLRELARGTKRQGRRPLRRGNLLERLEDRRLLSTVISPYGGNHGITQPNPGPSGISPPDLGAAIGPKDLLEFTDAQYNDLNLVSGVYTHQETPAQFWSRVGISFGTTPYDTRAVYDPLVGKFFVVALSGANTTSNKVLLAVSNTNQADGGWYAFSFNANSAEGGYQTYADNLTLGADVNGIYLATRNRVVGSGAYVDSSIFATAMSPLLFNPMMNPGAPAPALSRWQAVYPANADWFQPAVNFSSGQSGAGLEYILAPVFWNNATYLEISSINWPIGGAPNYAGASLCPTNGAYSPPPNGTQPAGFPQLDSGGEVRIQNAVVANGSIYTIFSANIGGNAGGVFTQTQLSNISVLYQTAWMHQAGVDYLYPSIAVNAAGWVTVGATAVSPSMYPSTVALGRRPTDAPNTLGPVTVVEAGAVGYTGAFVSGSSTVVKWGEYSTTLVDANNNYTFWTLQSDSVSSSVANNWTTWFEEYGLTNGTSGAMIQGGGATIGPVSAASTLAASRVGAGNSDLLVRAHKKHGTHA